MTTYTFEAYGKSIELEGDDKGAALVVANDWLNSLSEREMGCWFPTTTVNRFYWAEGNFFD
jgi:hypothetical protein